MGGDFAPEQIVFGAVRAARKYECEIVLVGDEEKIRAVLKHEKDWEQLGITIHHASEVIGMDEHPADAVRTKKDSSVVVATRLVKEGECDAVLSAGSTGAAVTAAQLILKRIRGVGRPAIATPLPTLHGVTLLLDSGANVDSRPEHLVQSGVMGSIYAEYVYGKKSPKVGLLNIGEEETKGNTLAQETHKLLAANKEKFNFVGNIEGKELLLDSCDVVVCDGFVGNVTLKVTEGTATLLFKLIKEQFGQSLFGGVVGIMAKTFLNKIYQRINYEEYGGMLLLGVKGITVISHGRSKAYAIKNAVRVAKEAVETGLNKKISELIGA